MLCQVHAVRRLDHVVAVDIRGILDDRLESTHTDKVLCQEHAVCNIDRAITVHITIEERREAPIPDRIWDRVTVGGCICECCNLKIQRGR